MASYILDYTPEELQEYFTGIDQPSYRTAQVRKGIYTHNYDHFDQFTNLPKELRSQLADDFALRQLELVDQIISDVDDTTKFLWELADGKRIESVTIYDNERVTFCISSQVGCPLDCKFCATGKMGLVRNLTRGEIVEQVLQMKKRSLLPPTNIVFMGMGEPMLNYDQVMQAAWILADPEGMCFSRKKITVSTSGIIKNIRRMADEDQPFSLAISLNSVRQDVRRQIMPVSKKYPLDDLMEAARYYNQKTGRRVTFEYVLIDGMNDSEEDARLLVKLTHGLSCKVNIIPCNSDDPLYRPPAEATVNAFDQIVNSGQRTVTIRNRKGWEIQAACGQLYARNDTPVASDGISVKKYLSPKKMNA